MKNFYKISAKRFTNKQYLLIGANAATKIAEEYKEKYVDASMLYKFKRLIKYHKHQLFFILGRLGLRFQYKAVLFFGKFISLRSGDDDAFFTGAFGTLAGDGEHPFITYLIQTLKGNDVFYDIGANYGFYTLLANELISEGKIHAFEPQPDIFSSLKRTLNINNISSIALNNVALSNSKGFLTMYTAKASGISTVIQKVTEHHNVPWNTISVPAITLDEYIKSNDIPTFIKLDVEGAEQLVLEGSVNLLTKYSPVVAMEVWEGDKGNQFSKDAVHFLLNLGYSPYMLHPDGTLEKCSEKYFQTLNKISGGYGNFIFKKNDK